MTITKPAEDPGETFGYLLDTCDAMEWSKAWCETAASVMLREGTPAALLDPGWMVAWFANAIETAKNIERTRLERMIESLSASVCAECGSDVRRAVAL